MHYHVLLDPLGPRSARASSRTSAATVKRASPFPARLPLDNLPLSYERLRVVISKGVLLGHRYGPLFDSGGVCSMGSCLEYGIYLVCTRVQIMDPY